MTDKIQCAAHGESKRTFVCSHLASGSSGLGFNQGQSTGSDELYPDAWCDNCELIREAHQGWNEQSEKLIKLSVLCGRCYEQSQIRNTRTSVTLDDLAGLRWKCGTCEEWHTGACLDFGYLHPYYWSNSYDKSNRLSRLLPWSVSRAKDTFLDDNFCAIEDHNFFVRGLIRLPIMGTEDFFRWGVWGSLSRENFRTLLKMDDDPKREALPVMFSWLSTELPEYPETLSLKMYAHIQKPGQRPLFELELSDHPLSREYHYGIDPQRVREIMLRRLRECEPKS